MTFAVQFPLHWPADYFTAYLIIKNNKQWSHQNDVKNVPEWGLIHFVLMHISMLFNTVALTYLEPSRTSTIELFAKAINDF